MRALPLLAAAIVLAGCSGASGPATGPGEPSAAAAIDLSRIELSGCTFTSYEETYPAHTAPGAAPPGWEPDTAAISTLRLDLWDCGDVRLAGESWGAAILMAEYSPSNAYHSGCDAVEYAYVHHIVHQVWTDRADLAAAVRERLGRDMVVGTFEGCVALDGNVLAAHWRWWTGYFEPSTLTVRVPDSHVTGTGGFGGTQWLWFNSTSVMTVDLDMDGYTNDFVFVGAGAADLQPPMLMSQDGLPEGATPTANLAPSFQGAGPVIRYRDLYCEDPIRDGE